MDHTDKRDIDAKEKETLSELSWQGYSGEDPAFPPKFDIMRDYKDETEMPSTEPG